MSRLDMRVLVAGVCALATSAFLHAQPAAPQPRSETSSMRVKQKAPLVNAGFESREPGLQGAPHGWWRLQHAGPESYRFEIDTENPHGGERSLRIANMGPEPFGTILQKVAAEPYRGTTLRLTAWLRTDEAKGNRYGAGAGLYLHAMRGGYAVGRVGMRKDAVAGTTGWKRYELVLAIPDEANEIEFGLNLFGAGRAWLDDVELAVVESP